MLIKLKTMKRGEFLKKSLITGAAAASAPAMLRAEKVTLKESNYDKFMENVGFNHLPNKEIKTMNTVVHKASSRGHANHGWLDTHHTFSFANYYNPDRMNFGVLRVLNDDVIDEGTGFGTHPHDNMEIVSIPLEGDLEHKDSMGNTAVIKQGDVQVMSAGTGVFHSEYNKNKDQKAKFLQIWIFPDKRNVTPRYDQISLEDVERKNEFYQILSPTSDDQGVWIHQNAWFHLGDFNESKEMTYKFKDEKNGLYVFVLNGSVKIDDQELNKRDGMGLWNVNEATMSVSKNSRLLLMEVPMSI